MRDGLVEVSLEMRGDEAVVALAGEVDGSNARELRAAIIARLPPDADCLILDLSEIRYLDSSGIELLFELGARLTTRRQTLLLVVPDDSPVLRVLELCDISSATTVHATVDDALARHVED
jgi:anti-anti-sigma factor